MMWSMASALKFFFFKQKTAYEMRISDWSSDVCSSDLVMPGMGGFDGCRRLKAEPATAHLPVIFMTGLTETADVLRGLEAGGVDYVTKPLVLEVLVARIAVHLGNARLARRALRSAEHTSELQPLMRLPSAVFCLKK